MAAKVTIQTLLDAGCHYGHQTRRWNPKMKPYIFGERNGIYILDLKQTLVDADKAYTFLRETAAKGGKVLFVGTKKQAQEPIQTQAERANMPYINQRWLGGMLTNFVTMRSRIARMEELEAMVEDGRMNALPKKEQALLTKELDKLQKNLGGVRDMTALPQAIFVVDTKREEIAVREANRLHIPVVGLLDTNSDPRRHRLRRARQRRRYPLRLSYVRACCRRRPCWHWRDPGDRRGDADWRGFCPRRNRGGRRSCHRGSRG